MTGFKLILRNLWFFRKPNIAILLGTIISTAVLTGALIVGDSVRYSLINLTEIRLGKTRFALQSGERFFRSKLAYEIGDELNTLVVPVLQSDGVAINIDKDIRINRIQVNGIEESYLKLWDSDFIQPQEDEAIISENIADKLDLNIGDEFLLKIPKISLAPQNAPFVSEIAPSISIRLKIKAIANDKNLGRFSLKSNQTAPYNVFISHKFMTSKLELNDYANLILVSDNEEVKLNLNKLDSILKKSWKPEDAGINIKKIESSGKYEITSSRIFIEDSVSQAIQKIIPGSESILTYLVNEIRIKEKTTPYSFVTAANDIFFSNKLAENEIIINNWISEDLKVTQGDTVQLKYFVMGPLRSLKEDSSRFIVKLVIPVKNDSSIRSLMPDFPGLLKANNCRNWETGIPIDLKKIRDKDEKYWNDFKGTPKGFISISSGHKLWQNKFGKYTAFRFKPENKTITEIQHDLMNKLQPSAIGLKFKPVFMEGEDSANNSTDFGELFLSLSFFILASGLLLVALLFSLQVKTRLSEIGILSAIGFRKKKIIKILCTEAAIVSLSGAIIGAFAGIIYNFVIIWGLNSVWQDAVRTSMLDVYIKLPTLAIGAASGVVTALGLMVWIIFRNLRQQTSYLIKESETTTFSRLKSKQTISQIIAIISIISSIILIINSLSNSTAINPEMFLTAGGLLLIGCIAALNLFLLRATNQNQTRVPGFYKLIFKNLALKRIQTISAVGLLALGTFTVLITGANRKTYYGAENVRKSGTGGFLFWTETSIPILNNLNTSEGKMKYALEDETVLKGVNFIQMHRLDGNDASCLNLNQVSQPLILGVNSSLFDQLKSFEFENLDSTVDKSHPWKALRQTSENDIVPAYADQSVITWGIRKTIGDTLIYLDESGKILKIRLIGGLSNSIFQGNILIDDSIFINHYPSVSGSKIMLIDGNFDSRIEIAERLENLFKDYGIMVTPASQRLAEFNSVENTYLSVFMALGGLGIIIGTFGLGIILFRNIYERKSELALYLALGYSKKMVKKIIFTEYLLILSLGVLIGLLSATAGILPSLVSPAYNIPGVFVFLIVVLIFISGFISICFSTRKALTDNLIGALRKE